MFIAKADGNTLKAQDPQVVRPILISIINSYSDTIGTYQEIISVEDASAPQLGYGRRYDPHYTAKRFDVYGGLSKTRLGLYYTTTTANSMSITPPYYKHEAAFKIRISSFCLTIDKDNYLVKGECVDDNNGVPTPENDRQLFEFCAADKIDACLA